MDTRTRAAKLRAMADQITQSPHEAAIAAAKLLEMGAGDREPPDRPIAAPAPGDGGGLPWIIVNYSWSNATGGSTTITVNLNPMVRSSPIG